jgi:hypothetical protein
MDSQPGSVRLWWDALTHPHLAGRFISDRAIPRVELWLLLGVAAAYAIYGSSMGITRGSFPAAVSALKLPLLYLLTLTICFPCFYALNGLLGPRLRLRSCVRLLLLAISANAIALLSYAPVSFFFSLTTSTATAGGYRFILLMHVAVFSGAGLISMGIILLVFRAAAAELQQRARPAFLGVFAAVYGLVGLQAAWVLRPWVGSWFIEYQPFRPIGSSIFETVARLVAEVW